MWPSIEQICATCTQEIKYPESANAAIGLWMKLPTNTRP